MDERAAKKAATPEPTPATVKVVKFVSVKRAEAPAGPPANVLKDGDNPLFWRSECYVSWYEVHEVPAPAAPKIDCMDTYRRKGRLYVRLGGDREVEIGE